MQTSNGFKRKFPRRRFVAHTGVLHRGVYDLCQSAVIGEGGMAFLTENKLPQSGLVVVSFKIPGDSLIAVRGEIRNVQHKKDMNLYFHGIQFFSLPIGYRRKIRSYVSSRLKDEEIV